MPNNIPTLPEHPYPLNNCNHKIRVALFTDSLFFPQLLSVRTECQAYVGGVVYLNESVPAYHSSDKEALTKFNKMKKFLVTELGEPWTCFYQGEPLYG